MTMEPIARQLMRIILGLAAVVLLAAAPANADAGLRGRQFEGLNEKGMVYFTALSPDGASLAGLHGDGRIDLWDAASGKRLKSIPSGKDMIDYSYVRSFIFSAKGGAIHLTYARELLTIDVATGTVKRRPLPDVTILAAHAAEDGTLKLAATDQQGKPAIVFGKVGGGSPPLALPVIEYGKYPHWGCPAFSGDGRIFAVGCPRDKVGADRGINPDTAPDPEKVSVYTDEREPSTIVAEGKVRSVALSHDGKRLAIGTQKSVEIWDTAAKHRVVSVPLPEPESVVTNIVLSRDGETIVYAVDMRSGFGATRHRLLLLEAVAGAAPVALETKMDSEFDTDIKSLHFSQGGTLIAHGSYIPKNISDYATSLAAFDLDPATVAKAADSASRAAAELAAKKQAEAAAAKAREDERQRKTAARQKAVADLDCETVKSLDAGLDAPRFKECLEGRRKKALAAFDCEQVKTLDKELTGPQHNTCLFEKLSKGGTARELYLAAVKLDADKERGRAKTLYATILERFPNDDLAIKAGERLAALADVEAIESSNAAVARSAEQAKAAAEAEGRANRDAIDRASRDAAYRQDREREKFCDGRHSCTGSCSSLSTFEARSHCYSQCSARYSGC